MKSYTDFLVNNKCIHMKVILNMDSHDYNSLNYNNDFLPTMWCDKFRADPEVHNVSEILIFVTSVLVK